MATEKKITLKETVISQLESEYFYYAEVVSLDFAEIFRLEFFDKVQSILPLYKRYAICKYKRPINKYYRQMIWREYLIIYKITEEYIEVLCLFHTKQHPRKIAKMI